MFLWWWDIVVFRGGGQALVLGVLIVLGFVYWWYDLRDGLIFRFGFGACCWFDMVCFGFGCGYLGCGCVGYVDLIIIWLFESRCGVVVIICIVHFNSVVRFRVVFDMLGWFVLFITSWFMVLFRFTCYWDLVECVTLGGVI